MWVRRRLQIAFIGLAVCGGMLVFSSPAAWGKPLTAKDLAGGQWHQIDNRIYITFFSNGTYKREIRHKRKILARCEGRYRVRDNIVEMKGDCETRKHYLRLEIKYFDGIRMKTIRHSKDAVSRKTSSSKATYKREESD